MAFPILINKTDKPVIVERLRLVHVPSGIRILGYRAQKVGGPAAYYTSYEGTGRRDDYLRYPNLFHPGHTKIRPHSVEPIFFAADLRVVKLTTEYITGCQVIYKTQGKTEQQTFDCEYAVSHP